MSNALKNIEIEGTIYHSINQKIDYFDKLVRLGVISYKLTRGARICDKIYKNCYQNTESKAVIEHQIAKEYKISVVTVRRIWSFMMQPFE